MLQSTGWWCPDHMNFFPAEAAQAIPISVFLSTNFSLKPVDIPSFLCCFNANLSAPLKRGRQEGCFFLEGVEGGRKGEDQSTYNKHCMDILMQEKVKCKSF